LLIFVFKGLIYLSVFLRRQRKTIRISINRQMALLFLVLQRKEAIVVCQCAGNGDFWWRKASIRLV